MAKVKRKKGNTWFNKYWVLNETWTKAFFVSHLMGWLIAWLQTLWIIFEVRKRR